MSETDTAGAFRLFDDPGADVAQIVTDGSTIKPFLNSVAVAVGEAKLRITEQGLGVTAVDPANVFMADVFVPSDAFETYDLADGAGVIGVDVGDLSSLVRRARKDSDDELTLSIRERELTATVARGYDNHDVVSNGTMDLFDPDSIRQEPEIPALDRAVDVSLETEAFIDALGYAVGASEYVEFAVKGVNQHATALYLGGETDTRAESIAIDSVDAPACEGSIYSKDYLKGILSGLSEPDADTVGVEFDEEIPATFTATGDDLHVEYMLAPRVQS